MVLFEELIGAYTIAYALLMIMIILGANKIEITQEDKLGLVLSLLPVAYCGLAALF